MTDARTDSADLLGLIAPGATRVATPDSEAALRRLVARYTAVLLAENRPLLLSVLYRIDVPEARVREAFASAAPADLPDTLAGLMIDRHRQKRAYRAAHRMDHRPPGASSPS